MWTVTYSMLLARRRVVDWVWQDYIIAERGTNSQPHAGVYKVPYSHHQVIGINWQKTKLRQQLAEKKDFI